MICTYCGASMTRDEPVERNGFSVDPRGAVCYLGQNLSINGAQRTIFHALASCATDVTIDALLGRIGADETHSNTIAAHVCYIRRKLRAIGAPDVIVNTRNAYRWQPTT